MAPKRKLATDAKPRASKRVAREAVNPTANSEVIDGVEASRASPDDVPIKQEKPNDTRQTENLDFIENLGADDAVGGDVEDVQKSAARPPAVNSDILPLPWKGRLGYVRSP